MNARALAIAASALPMALLFSLPAGAQEPPVAAEVRDKPAGFGAAGQVSLNVDIPYGTTTTAVFLVHQQSSGEGDGSTTIWAIAPSLDYFVVPHLSVGGQLGIMRASYSSGSSGTTSTASSTSLIVGARVGYDIAFNDDVSLWPRLIALYNRGSTSLSSDASLQTVSLGLFAPFLWHPAEHFFMGAGPFVQTELVNKAGDTARDKSTQYGLQAIVGGYFGGG